LQHSCNTFKDEHKKYYSCIYCIVRSALCNLLFVWKFDRRKTGAPVSTTHIAPGLIRGILSHYVRQGVRSCTLSKYLEVVSIKKTQRKLAVFNF